MKTIGRDFGDVARKVYATASGTLPNGKPIVVNADGTVSVISGADQALGSPTIIQTSGSKDAYSITSVFDPDNNKVVIAYQNGADSNHGYAVVGTISGTSVTFGTAVEFLNAIAGDPRLCYDTNSNKVVIIYTDYGNSYYATARVGTVSGTNISFGTAVVYKSTTVANTHSIVFDSNANKVVIGFGDNGNSVRGTAVVGTVSGTNISFGTAVVFHTGDTNEIHTTFDSTANKVIFTYRDTTESQKGKAIVGTVSGTGISFGSEATYVNAATTNYQVVLYNSDSNKTLIVYPSGVSPYYTVAVVGTISGTNISFGTSVNIETTSGANDAAYASAIAYDPDSQGYAVLMDEYINSNTSYNGHLQTITISGTTPVIGDKTVFYSGRIYKPSSLSYDTSSDRFIVSYIDLPAGYVGKSMTVKIGSTNLTAENYIGMTPSAYPSGAGAEIDTKGAINTEQSSLTAGQSYFVQTDGTITTTAGDPSVFAGTAVSATKLIVKG